MVTHSHPPADTPPPAQSRVPLAWVEQLLRNQEKILSYQRAQVEAAQHQLVSRAWIQRQINKPHMSAKAFYSMMSRARIPAVGHKGYPRHRVEADLLHRNPVSPHRR